ncbi:MAG: hypothetical protein KDA61_11580, partial [Planctomycetales bacterium]|nr:hypothetical protein [Planctomycetales bacterium]
MQRAQTYAVLCGLFFWGHATTGVQAVHAATLAFVSQHGFPHVYCRLQFDDGSVRWMGFVPNERRPIHDGHVDESAADDLIDDYVLFHVDEQQLKTAAKQTTDAFQGAQYNLATRNCIDFARTLAGHAGLSVEKRSARLTPKLFVNSVAKHNEGALIARDVRPVAWLEGDANSQTPVTLCIAKVHCRTTEGVFTKDKIYIRVHRRGRESVTSSRHSMNNGDDWSPGLRL